MKCFLGSWTSPLSFLSRNVLWNSSGWPRLVHFRLACLRMLTWIFPTKKAVWTVEEMTAQEEEQENNFFFKIYILPATFSSTSSASPESAWKQHKFSHVFIRILFFTERPCLITGLNANPTCLLRYFSYLVVYVKNKNSNSVQLSSEFNSSQVSDVGLMLTLWSTIVKHELLTVTIKNVFAIILGTLL